MASRGRHGWWLGGLMLGCITPESLTKDELFQPVASGGAPISIGPIQVEDAASLPEDPSPAGAGGGSPVLDGGDPRPPLDAGDGSSPLSPKPGFDFRDHTVLWLSAETVFPLRDSRVSQWPDLSGRGNVAEAVKGHRPQLVVDAIGGRPAVRFDGQDSYMSIEDHSSLDWGTDPYLVCTVARYHNSDDDTSRVGLLLAKLESDELASGVGLFMNYEFNRGGFRNGFMTRISINDYATSPTGMNDGNPRVFCARRHDSPALEVLVNRQAYQPGRASVDVSNDETLFIGGRPYLDFGVTEALDGDVAEIIAVVGSAVDNEMVVAVQNYLMTKYAIEP